MSSGDDNTNKESAEGEDDGGVEWGESVEVTNIGKVSTGVLGGILGGLGGTGQEGGETSGTLTAFELGKTIIVGEVNVLALPLGGKGLNLTSSGGEGLGGRAGLGSWLLGSNLLGGNDLLDDLLGDGLGDLLGCGLLGGGNSTGSQGKSGEGLDGSQKAQGQSKYGEGLHGG